MIYCAILFTYYAFLKNFFCSDFLYNSTFLSCFFKKTLKFYTKSTCFRSLSETGAFFIKTDFVKNCFLLISITTSRRNDRTRGTECAFLPYIHIPPQIRREPLRGYEAFRRA